MVCHQVLRPELERTREPNTNARAAVCGDLKMPLNVAMFCDDPSIMAISSDWILIWSWSNLPEYKGCINT